MTDLIGQHLWRLRIICGAILLSCGIYGLVVVLLPAPELLPLNQAKHLLWILALIGLVNLVTLMPVYRSMLAGPRRISAVSGEIAPLLSAHFAAHVVAFARLELLAVFGLVLFFISGRAEWFWIFNGIAATAMIVLWPLKDRIAALVDSSITP